jgi:putative oxidoreductase
MRFIIYSVFMIGIILLISFFLYHSDHLRQNLWLFFSLAIFILMIIYSVSLFRVQKLFILALLLSTALLAPLIHISALVNEYGLFIPAGIMLLLLFIVYMLYAREHLSHEESALTLMRVYLGLYLLIHASNKLFAGNTSFSENVNYFISLNIPKADYFVVMAGVYEFLGGLFLTVGLFTRLSAVLSSVYLLIAVILGHHFFMGFLWTSTGGGWEYPVLWIVFTMIFAYLGGGKCSVDYLLKRDKRYPRWYQDFM